MTTYILTALALIAGFTASAVAQPSRPLDTGRTVTLSLNEYNRLTDLANRPPAAATVAPVPAVLASADLRVRADRDTARGVFNLAGEVLRTGISRVSLVSGATLVDATAAGRPLPLVVDGTAHAALLAGPNPFSLTLEWGAPLVLTPGRASFTLPVPPAGSVRATFDLPGEQADVHLSAGLVTRRSSAGGRTVIEATLAPGTATEVWWSMRDSSPVAAAREARTLGDVMTLLTIGDSEVRMVTLIDLTVVQGEPRAFEVRLPAGYELTGISGSSLESSDQPDGGSVILTIADPAARQHQFLMTLERPHAGGSFALETAFVTLPGVQRQRGEIAVEGVGTMELAAREADGMHRIDVRELNPAVQSLSRLPILSAFRYQQTGAVVPGLALDVKRFADAGVLAAVADRAVATTLVTAEGRALTEISLLVRNRAQPFLKVTLPTGASIVSVEVAGEAAKPVLGADGTRVPLLRPGFRPQGAYAVSYVYLHAGTPFERKGDMQLALPRMDMPISIVEWEVFVPERYAAKVTDGNVIERRMLSSAVNTTGGRDGGSGGGAGTGTGSGVGFGIESRAGVAEGGVAGGIVGGLEAAPPPAPAAPVALEETLTVSGVRPEARAAKSLDAQRAEAPSQNVVNLQRRAAGVLPVRVDVPRAGTSHQFVKPLVVDQAPSVTFRYKRR